MCIKQIDKRPPHKKQTPFSEQACQDKEQLFSRFKERQVENEQRLYYQYRKQQDALLRKQLMKMQSAPIEPSRFLTPEPQGRQQKDSFQLYSWDKSDQSS